MPRLRPARLFALALGLTLAAPAARAQRVSGPLAGHSTSADLERADVSCHRAGAASVDLACALGATDARAAARVDAAGLHAGAWLDRHGAVTGQERARGYAAMYDRLTFSGPEPFALRFTLQLHGRVQGDAAWGALSGGSSAGEPQGVVELGNTGGAWSTVSGTFETPVVGGVVDFAFWLETNARFALAPEGSTCAVSCETTAFADFSNTAWVAGIEGLDADGRVITSGLVARSASGTAYALAGGVVVTATPEPASAALLAAGVLPLALALRRRPRRVGDPRTTAAPAGA